MFPHNITVFNKVKTGTSVSYLPTIIKGTLFTRCSQVSISKSGFNPNSDFLLIIPFGVAERSSYLDKTDYDKLSNEDKVKHWTLSKDDIIVKDESTATDMTAQTINTTYTNKFTISSVDVYDYGSLKNWKVSGA